MLNLILIVTMGALSLVLREEGYPGLAVWAAIPAFVLLARAMFGDTRSH